MIFSLDRSTFHVSGNGTMTPFDGAPTTTATICFLFGLTDGVATSPELVSSTESNCVDAMLRPGKDVLLL